MEAGKGRQQKIDGIEQNSDGWIVTKIVTEWE